MDWELAWMTRNLGEELSENGFVKNTIIHDVLVEIPKQQTILQYGNVVFAADVDNLVEISTWIVAPRNVVWKWLSDETIHRVFSSSLANRLSIDLEELLVEGGTDDEDLFLSLIRGLKAKSSFGNIPAGYLKVFAWAEGPLDAPASLTLKPGEVLGTPPRSFTVYIYPKIRLKVDFSDDFNDIIFKMELFVGADIPEGILLERIGGNNGSN